MVGTTPSTLEDLFAGRDVAIVCLLAALPLAAVVAEVASRRSSRAGRVLLGGFTLGCGVAIACWGGVLEGDVLRLLIAAAFAVGAVLMLTGVAPAAWQAPLLQRARGRGAVLLAVAVVILPTVYVDARSRHDLQQLTILIEQSRLGEADTLAGRIVVLRPTAMWQGQPVARVRHELERSVAEIRQRVAAPLAVSADFTVRVDRARDLAILGETGAALRILQDDRVAAYRDPEVMNLVGTIHETRSEWSAAREWYARGRDAAAGWPASGARQAVLQRAVRGIAYAERKLGRVREAEAAYRELLAVAPTAETHFLLAQFYEDAQQASLAREHARQAMRLDARRYAQAGRRLIDKLVTFHFGCLGVYRAERGEGDRGGGRF